MNRTWKWVLLLAVAAAPWLAGRSHPFLYDDVGMIAENEFLENPANLGKVLTGQTLADPHVVNGRRPAVLATYFLDRALYGLRPAGWRATSLALHLACAALLAGLLRRLTRNDYLAAAAGLLFALHPATSEAVHAPGFRADVLCLFFVLVFLHAFLAPGPRAGIRRMGGLAGLALALLAKETAVVAPLLLGALMVLFPAAFPGSRRDKVVGWAAAAGLAALFFALWLALPTDLQAAGGAWNGESLRFPETLYSAPALWARSLRLLLVPWPLNVTPGFAPVVSPTSLRSFGGLIWLALGAVGACKARKAAPELSLGLAWMLAFFLPVSNLWPLLHPVADRYLYPLAPGFAIVAAWILAHQSRRGRALGLAALAALFALLLAVRLGQWASAEKLWSAAYFQNPRSATAATWLGLLRQDAGDADGARAFYQAATEANPQAAAAWINWGVLEGQAENWAESERLLRRAVELQPGGAKGWINLATCLERQGRSAEAEQAAARAEALRTP
ncbi:MAG: tetratricopeptide repeat protein [Kiritimatiellia bacterium]